MPDRARKPNGTAAAALLRVYTLGRFAIERGGEPAAAGRGGGKPLALLKALIALGGEGVHAGQLAESLWPDSDGDQAYSAFTTTLRRLRGVIGAEALRLEGGRLSLDAHHCWADARAYTEALARAEQRRRAGELALAGEQLDEALALYRGPFLPGEFEPPEVLAARERLHGAFLRHVGEQANALAAAGEREAALVLCRRALEADDVAEELVRRAMTLCRDLGRPAEGLAAYERCRELLRATAGAEPDAQTEALARALREMPAAATGEPARESQRSGSAAGKRSAESPLRTPVLAVLPFAALGGEEEQAAFSAGLSEDLAAALAQLVGLRVLKFDAPPPGSDAHESASAGGATHLLEGTVRHSGTRVRITVGLTEAASRRQVWAERYDRDMADLFAVQDEISDRIVTELDVQLVEGEQARLRRRGTRSVEAWRLVKQANAHYFFGRTLVSQGLAYDAYRRTAEADADYAYPVRMMFNFRAREILFGIRAGTPETLEHLEQLAARACELDPHAAGNLGMSARMHLVRRQFDAASDCARAAIAAEPEHADLMMLCAMTLLLAGHADEALQTCRLAIQHGSGRIHVLGAILGPIQYVREQYEESLQAFQTTAISPHAIVLHPFGVGAAVALRRHEEGLALHAAYRDIGGDAALLGKMLDALPFRDPSVIEQLRGHLRKVGLP